MPAYMAFIKERVRNQDEMTTYSGLAGKSFAGREMKVLAAYGPTETFEGAPAEGVVLIEFPSVADAKAWYNSDAYVEARQHRQLGGDYRVILFEGR